MPGSHKITLFLAGCADRLGSIVVDATYQEIGACIVPDGSNHDNFKQRVKVPLFTLQHILEQNRIVTGDIVLKIDCEGCEYDLILAANDEVLQLFSHIMIEYHYGYRSLKQKLENCGFKLSITKPHAHKRDYLYEFPEDKWMYVGHIYAQRNTK
jgi:FkbM family methyltransferase